MIEPRILAAIAARLTPVLITRARPGHRLMVDGAALGYFDAARMQRLAAFGGVFVRHGEDLAFIDDLPTCDARTRALEPVTHALAREGALTTWRDERYSAAKAGGAPPAFVLERAAARYFGIHTYAAHANGLVVDAGNTRMWLARRSPRKPIDPDQLDNLVGGGIAAGEDPRATLVREAWEEAGIVADVASKAHRVAALYVERSVPDGFQRETLFAYDLPLPVSFVPANQDGEAVEHRRVDFETAAALIARASGPDIVTVDASVVILDCLLRYGVARPEHVGRALLDALRCVPAA